MKFECLVERREKSKKKKNRRQNQSLCDAMIHRFIEFFFRQSDDYLFIYNNVHSSDIMGQWPFYF